MKDMNEITTKIIKIAADQAGVSIEEVTRETNFVNDLNFDSLDAVEFAMSLEDEFGVTVPDEEMENIKTIDDAVQLVKKEDEAPAGKKQG
jgi:acyl carrier protein